MSFNQEAVQQAIYDLLLAMGEDPNRPGLKETPQRVSKAWEELLKGQESDPAQVLETVFDVGYTQPVIMRDIPFYSQCEHHLLPFTGVAHVGYIPADGKVTGLSKLARLVEGYAARLQLQEQLTLQIAQALMDKLQASGAGVVIEAEHMCMSMRGVKSSGARTVTMQFLGTARTDSQFQSTLLGN